MIDKIIENSLILDYMAQEKRDYIGISEISYCITKLYRKKTRDEKTELPVSTLFKFLKGHAIHEYLQSLLWKYRGQNENFVYYKAEKEVFISDILKGHIDLVCKIADQMYVVDFKTVGQQEFSKIKKNGIRLHDKGQISLYADSINARCMLIYMTDSFEKIVFDFEPDRDLISELTHKAITLNFHIINKEEPPKPFENANDSWECNYCQYYYECWQDKKEFKKDNEVILSIAAELENEYIETVNEIKELEAKADEIKARILENAKGEKIEGQSLFGFYTPESESSSYDKTKLLANVPIELLQKCEKITKKKGYYTLKQRRE